MGLGGERRAVTRRDGLRVNKKFFQAAVHLALEDNSNFNDVNMLDATVPPAEPVIDITSEAGRAR